MSEKKDFNDIKLLYVENSESTLLSNVDYFSQFFDTIIVAKDGKEAFEKFQENQIDMMITDIDPPLLDGLGLIQKIKAINENIITLIHSSCENTDIFLQAIALGIDGYLLKPLNTKKFEELLHSSYTKYLTRKKHQLNERNLYFLNQHNDVINKNTIVSKADSNGIITYANENFCKASEYSYTELIGQSHNIIRHPDNPKELFKEMWKTIRGNKQEWNGILKNRTKSGKSYYVKSAIKPILDEHDNIIEYIGVRNNISAVMSDKKQLLDKISDGHLSLLLLVQIDEFDILDKFYNIQTIDKLEKMFGYELLSYLPNGYIFENLYNIGNGQFALLTDFYNYINTEHDIKEYLDEFSNNVRQSILTIDGIEYDLNILISYSFGKENLYEDAKCGLDELIHNKELIHYANDSSIKEHKLARQNINVLNMVKIALDNYNIISYFQPIIHNKTKEIAKYESLVRLIDQEGNVLSPFHFLDISKKGNYYNKITHRVLENSFKILEQISTKLSINISSVDIEKEETRKKVYELLETHKDDASRIIFELLEDENVKNFSVIKKFIQKVKKMGVQIAIDDFGAGYSNFERLLDFEPDILKIDGSLIRNITTDNYSRNVVETIVSFAKKQNIETIAEFVENEEIFNILNLIGVDYSQGYYFGKAQSLTPSKQ